MSVLFSTSMRSRADSVPCMDDAGSATVTMQLTLTPEPSAAVPVMIARRLLAHHDVLTYERTDVLM